MPQYAVLIYADDSAHALDATDDDLAESDGHAQELADSGAMKVAFALTPRSDAVSIRASGVSSEPFINDSPIVAGFYVIDAADLDAAIAIARTTPVVRSGTGGVEVRLVHSGGVIGD